MHPKKQAKSPSLPFNIKSSSPIQHAVKHHHIAVVTTTSTTTSSTKSHSSSHSLSSPQLMHMNHNEVGAVHHHMNQYPFHQQHSTISSSRYSPVSSPNIFIKRLQSSAPASPSTSESSFSVSRLTSTSYRPATLINTSSPSTTLMTTSSTSEAGVPVYAASRKETSSDFDGDHYYQRHQHHSSSGSSSSIASHEASSSVHSRAPSVVEYQGKYN